MSARTSLQIRHSFLDFFKARDHAVVRSSPLVPQNDPTLLFTNAGMVQFKDVFTGKETRDYRRATTAQKCVRAGGKHNDLENVGRTARHHTLFEMLGNFSFGDYFKEGAIDFAWSWLIDEMGLDPQRMIITVFGGDESLQLGPDDEARALWKKRTGFGDDRIRGLGMKDNFWMMGDTGPQGPCSELHYFVGDGAPTLDTFGDEPAADGSGWMEIWNLVFMQFERATKESPLVPLPRPSIDTGAGLERVTAVVQNVKSNYDTDLLRPLVERAAEMAKKPYGASMGDDDVSMRILADHSRATAFLMADGVDPSNEGRGYVLRRIMRRAIRHGVRLGLAQGQFAQLCDQVVTTMGEVYPELRAAKGTIAKMVDLEDVGFRRTLDRGIKLLDETIGEAKEKTLPGEVVFKLYDTYGFPADLTRVIAEERGFTVDEVGFDSEMEKQRARSSEFSGTGQTAVSETSTRLQQTAGETKFLGYQTTTATGTIVGHSTAETPILLVADQSPFYAESGGQVGDTGMIHNDHFEFVVTNTRKTPVGTIIHEGKLTRGSENDLQGEATFTVDADRRRAIRANHSATHLLHWALRKTLGDHVAQKGSLVAPDRLRFDFSHFAPMTEAERRTVEGLVNSEVLQNADTIVTETGFDEARALGAMALFGEKYGDRVRVLKIGSHSVELCGGTHVARAGDIGLFKIVSEVGIAQGIRRIEAVTGEGALGYVQKLEDELSHAAGELRAPLFSVATQIERLQKELKERDKKIEELQRKAALGSGGRDLMSEVRIVDGVKILAARADVTDAKALRDVADQLRSKLGSGVVILAGVEGEKVSLVAAVTADLVERYNAGKIIGELAKKLGGKGGGRADMAQGGGTDATNLDAALAAIAR